MSAETDSDRDDDSGAMTRLHLHFRLIRNQFPNSPLPSQLHQEILSVTRFAVRSKDPVAFLLKFGLILFPYCCAFNLSVLCDKISTSKTRVRNSFQREHWTEPPPGFNIRARLRDMKLDPRNWTGRGYPSDTELERFVLEHPVVMAVQPVSEMSPKPAMDKMSLFRESVELTLQKDIFSWTFWDDMGSL